MEFTLLGIITMLISLYAFFKNEKLLLYIMVFLSTFTAAELMHINVTTTPILTFEFTGSIWLLREFINFIKSKPKINMNIIINRFKENKLALAFLIFIVAIILGESYLAISKVTIDYINLNGESEIIKFSMSNITQSIIIIFVFIIMIALSFKIKTKKETEELLKVFFISSMFAVIWGLLQFIIYYLGISYPSFLFNNNIYSYQGYYQVSNNIKRICSIALEPSTFAINLTCFIPFILGMFLKNNGKISKNKFNLMIFIMLILTTVCAILTTSSTAYIGLIAVYGLYGIYILFGFIKNGELSNKKANFINLFFATITSIFVVCCFCLAFVKIGYELGTINYIADVQKEQTTDVVEESNNEVINQEETIIDNTNSDSLNNDSYLDETEYNSVLDNMFDTLYQMTIGKVSSDSGHDRLNGEKIGISLFQYSPLFGLGFGSYRSFSLFTNILINSGLFGILAFFNILYIVIKELINNRKKAETISIMFLISIVATTIAFFVGVPDLTLTYYWIIMVLGYKYSTLDY